MRAIYRLAAGLAGGLAAALLALICGGISIGSFNVSNFMLFSYIVFGVGCLFSLIMCGFKRGWMPRLLALVTTWSMVSALCAHFLIHLNGPLVITVFDLQLYLMLFLVSWFVGAEVFGFLVGESNAYAH